MTLSERVLKTQKNLSINVFEDLVGVKRGAIARLYEGTIEKGVVIALAVYEGKSIKDYLYDVEMPLLDFTSKFGITPPEEIGTAQDVFEIGDRVRHLSPRYLNREYGEVVGADPVIKYNAQLVSVLFDGEHNPISCLSRNLRLVSRRTKGGAEDEAQAQA